MSAATADRAVEGLVLELQRGSMNDGPGVRTTVFLKGCPLRCLWCHNPESQSFKSEINYREEKCVGCGNCARMYPECHRMENGRHIFIREKCDPEAPLPFCRGEALSRLGRVRDVGSVLDEVLRDRAFYETSGGGLTISGGEPMAQFPFTRALLRAAKGEGIHCCLDTCGFTDFENYAEILPFVDVFLFDVKAVDCERHRALTGVPNTRILENLRRLDAAGARTFLRCPIVPGYNDRAEDFAGIAALADTLRHAEQINLMPFHPWGRSKAHAVGHDYPLGDMPAVSDDVADAWVARLAALTKIPVSR